MKNYQVRDKFFYASPKLFPVWPYKSRLAIGMRLSDFTMIHEKTFRFQVKGIMYEIDSKKAIELGKRYQMKWGALPNIIPLEEFSCKKPAPVVPLTDPNYQQLAII